jgi:dihydroorotase-like cyclic amidohydrolase
MIIRRATALYVDTLQAGTDVRVGEGRILEIGPQLRAGAAERVIDAESLFALGRPRSFGQQHFDFMLL